MADRIEITVVVDNYIDIFLPSSPVASYPFPGATSRLLAEQGMSLWVELWRGTEATRVLCDFGRSKNVLLHNARLLGIDVTLADALVLSHGHADHYGSLDQVMKRTGGKCNLFLNPSVLINKRYVQLNDGSYVGPWQINKALRESFAGRMVLTSTPAHPAPDICISGEIPRRTAFEHGMANAYVRRGRGRLTHDDIFDDQALYLGLDGKGVVVLTGCCHSGVVNTLMYCQELFPEKKIYALIGGFHLNSANEAQMRGTIDYLAQLGIPYISALHCTGYYAQRELMESFRAEWIPGTVGARITLKS